MPIAQVHKLLAALDPEWFAEDSVLKAAIPSFHVWRHLWICATTHSPRQFEGIVADEFAEQLFSILHRLGYRTRHMSPKARAETINRFLMFHNWNVSDRILYGPASL